MHTSIRSRYRCRLRFFSLIPCLFFPSLWCSYADNQVRRVVIVTRGAVLGLDGQIGQTRRKSDRSLSSGGGGTARMQNTETRFDSTHLWLFCGFCCTTCCLYERNVPFSFPFTPYSLLFLSLPPSYIFFMYIQQLANPMLGFPCSAIPSSRFQQRPNFGHVSKLGGCRDQNS